MHLSSFSPLTKVPIRPAIHQPMAFNKSSLATSAAHRLTQANASSSPISFGGKVHWFGGAALVGTVLGLLLQQKPSDVNTQKTVLPEQLLNPVHILEKSGHLQVIDGDKTTNVPVGKNYYRNGVDITWGENGLSINNTGDNNQIILGEGDCSPLKGFGSVTINQSGEDNYVGSSNTNSSHSVVQSGNNNTISGVNVGGDSSVGTITQQGENNLILVGRCP